MEFFIGVKEGLLEKGRRDCEIGNDGDFDEEIGRESRDGVFGDWMFGGLPGEFADTGWEGGGNVSSSAQGVIDGRGE